MKTYDISIITAVYNEEGNIEELYRRVSCVMPEKYSWEIIFIDDGSSDNSTEKIRNLSKRCGNVTLVSFSRNYGHQIALTAGYDFAHGRAVISMDSDLQHPPEFLPIMIKCWENGKDIVLARRQATSGINWFKINSSRAFYYVFRKMSGMDIVPGVADFRLLDQNVVRCLRQFREKSRFLRGIISNLGFKRIVVDYCEGKRTFGKTKYSIPKMFQLSINGISSFSVLPIRLSAIIGSIISLCSLLYSFWIIYYTHRYGTSVPGVASILVGIFFLGGIQMIFIGILGEYIGKVFLEVKGQPLYIVNEIVENGKDILNRN